MTSNQDIVAKLWKLCNVLRDDGVTYHQYVTELTYLLFLKMMEETERDEMIPEGRRWSDLLAKDGIEQLTFYRETLLYLGTEATGTVLDIFASAQTFIREPVNLRILVQSINDLDWYDAHKEGLGDLYEGLLEKNASEKKSGAGQYFTPRPLIEAMVEVTKPQPGEIVSDPSSGTCGFLISANNHIKSKTDDHYSLPEAAIEFQEKEAFYGVELVPDTRRLGLMNIMLHGIDGKIHLGSTLSEVGEGLPKSNVILANPPFGSKKGGGAVTRGDFNHVTNNKQLGFLQHIYRNLKPGGRAAVVLPDNVLFEDGIGKEIRAELMNFCNLHTILRLPTGIFYAQGVKTNALFFQRGRTDWDNTKDVWFYDLRTNAPKFGKRTPFTFAYLQEFVDAYGKDPNGGSPRVDQGEEGKFRKFTRKEIADRGDNLDITWLRDDSIERVEDLPEPDVIAKEILTHLETATSEMKALMALLGEEVSG